MENNKLYSKTKMVTGLMVKSARMQAKMTQTELAKIVEIEPTYLSRIENGGGSVSLRLLVRIAEATKKSITILIDTKSI